MSFFAWIKSLAEIVKTAKAIWAGAASIWKAIQNSITKKSQEKETKQASDAVKEIEEADKIEDEDERLKKKADAACKLEKTINPDSDC